MILRKVDLLLKINQQRCPSTSSFFSNVHFDKTQAAGKRKAGPNKILEKAYTTRMKSYLPIVDLLIEIKIKRNG